MEDTIQIQILIGNYNEIKAVSFQTETIFDNYITISADTSLLGYTWFDRDTGASLYQYVNNQITAIDTSSSYFILCQQKMAIQNEIDNYKSLLSDSDYQAIKYAEGQLTAEEYEPMKIQRAAWRVAINELQQTLQNLGA